MRIEWATDPTCPHCGKVNGDSWDYQWGEREELETDCGHCGEPVTLSRSVSVDYAMTASKKHQAQPPKDTPL